MLPIHLDLGFTQIYFYEGIYFLISIILGVWWAKVRVEKYGGKTEKFEGLVVWSIVGALIGARLSHYVFWQSDVFFENPGVIFSPTGAGNSITGGLVGGMLGGYFYVKRNNMNYWEYFSLLSPGVLLGQAVGRVGCFLNGDAYGTATSSFLGVQFPRYATTVPDFETEYRLSSPAWESTAGLPGQTETLSAPVHPTQLYEMFGDVVLILIILWVFKKIWDTDKKSPLIFFIHTGGYSLLRFGLEYIRADKEGITMFGMSNLQIALLLYGLFTIGYATKYYLDKRSKTGSA
ncbi:MAG TPA: prolipoprotein diacylglyceryl transferase [Balneola sp.]|jgi:phosphatidylglycerol:prolipoprotein diacylglycerol transferase|nr:prolipoprotein diacylglyceryl transferase [Bacteroidota bacterium]MAC05934.1 prolipoprotein diacylglyceryl transferase [Balneola sp.]MAO77459.1 prolipoprotein diacylglyceryl transferase [Balneola sp.]MBF65417.1 prolipoprotein diacylglyceryl transferase [Balneola sp.]HAH51271.1 prolipoprotein diacylglyceryl transferase [Balneola sp.]|tara:strand:- start:3323 stop:4192 length:870 start_codon:yes stop_codon:yes gene_type:complete